ncbi:MAG: outer membrane beta-barrel protein [Bacteroidales bacterium]|nr:outer membrane beta-barrel protein [Bacteroidales bacterium]
MFFGKHHPEYYLCRLMIKKYSISIFRVKRLLLLLMLWFLSIAAIGQPVKKDNRTGEWNRWNIGTSFGYSNLLLDISFDLGDEFANYLKRLKSGYHLGIEGQYFFNPYLGANISVTGFYTREHQDSLTASNGFFTIKGNIKDQMRIYTVTPMVVGRYSFHNRPEICLGVGPAYLNYRNEGKALTDSATFTGSAAGLSSMIEIDYALTSRFSLGASSTYTHSVLKRINKITVAGTELMILNQDEYQDISRIDVSFHLRYKFRKKK